MKTKRLLTGLLLSSFFTLPLHAKETAHEKVTVALDWFINSDHAPLFVAKQIGAFQEQGLDVEFVPLADSSTDPAQGLKSHKTDLAISYQQAIYKLVEQGTPITRIGTLMDQPADMIAALPQSQIHSIADLKGKRIGYASGDPHPFVLEKILQTAGLTLKDVNLVNVGLKLVSSLEKNEVDAIYESLRNIEGVKIDHDTKTHPVEFFVEDYGIPRFDELIILANKSDIHQKKLLRFMKALKKGAEYLLSHPEESWKTFADQHPDLNSEGEHATWLASLPFFSQDPLYLNNERYLQYRNFLYDNHQINKKLPVSDYAVDLETSKKKAK